MTNDLRGHVVVSRTVPMGSYSSLKVEVMEEYLLSESSFEEKFDSLAQRLKEKLVEAGVVRE
jgi:hypothetical protein